MRQLTPTRIPPADPRRERAEGEPAPIVSLDGWSDRKRGSPDATLRGGTGPVETAETQPAALGTPWSAQPMVAIPQAKLEEILDKQDRIVRTLIEQGEHCDQNSAAVVHLRRLLQELLARLGV